MNGTKSGASKGVLIIVHPGSACGSAAFNLGINAGAARDKLSYEIERWRGDMLIVDGDLSDEIRHYARLSLAIENSLETCVHSGRRWHRMAACDASSGEWPKEVANVFRTVWGDEEMEAILTGAWTQADGNGCVDAVRSALEQKGVKARIARSALRLP